MQGKLALRNASYSLASLSVLQTPVKDTRAQHVFRNTFSLRFISKQEGQVKRSLFFGVMQGDSYWRDVCPEQLQEKFPPPAPDTGLHRWWLIILLRPDADEKILLRRTATFEKSLRKSNRLIIQVCHSTTQPF